MRFTLTVKTLSEPEGTVIAPVTNETSDTSASLPREQVINILARLLRTEPEGTVFKITIAKERTYDGR